MVEWGCTTASVSQMAEISHFVLAFALMIDATISMIFDALPQMFDWGMQAMVGVSREAKTHGAHTFGRKDDKQRTKDNRPIGEPRARHRLTEA